MQVTVASSPYVVSNPGSTIYVYSINANGQSSLYEYEAISSYSTPTCEGTTTTTTTTQPPVTTTTAASTDLIAPTLISSTPTDGATNVDWETNISLVFSEPVYWTPTGELAVRKGNEGESYVAVNVDPADDPSSASLVSGIGTNTITINPDKKLCELPPSWWYFLHIGPDALEDAAGNRFAGISNIYALTFRVEEPAIGFCNYLD